MGTFSTRDPLPVLIPRSGKPLGNAVVLSWRVSFHSASVAWVTVTHLKAGSGVCAFCQGSSPGGYTFSNCLSSCLQNRGKGDQGVGLVRTGLTAQTGTQVQSPSPTCSPDVVMHVCNLTQGDGSLAPVASQSLRGSGCQDGSVGSLLPPPSLMA